MRNNYLPGEYPQQYFLGKENIVMHRESFKAFGFAFRNRRRPVLKSSIMLKKGQCKGVVEGAQGAEPPS